MPQPPSSRSSAPQKRTKSRPGPAWRSRAPSREEQRQLKEDVLYETAARWFLAHGFHGTSLSDLASELGITKANLYNYFGEKGELLYQLHQRSLEVAEAAHRAAVAEGTTGLERVRLIARNYVRALTTSVSVTVIRLEAEILPREREKEILGRRRWLASDLEAQIAAGIADGSIVACNPKFMARNVIGILYWTTTWYRPGGAWDGKQVAEAVATSVARLLSRQPVDLPTDISAISASGLENSPGLPDDA
jgi:TetR/AcrR family transcriptional regulator